MHLQTHSDPCATSSMPDGRLVESVDQLLDLVAQEKCVPRKLLLSSSRCRANTAKARQLAMYLMHVALGQSLTAVGLAFGRDRTTVSYACGLMEDMRDDPEFDREVDRLEALLAQTYGVSHD